MGCFQKASRLATSTESVTSEALTKVPPVLSDAEERIGPTGFNERIASTPRPFSAGSESWADAALSQLVAFDHIRGRPVTWT
jgi:hypothetical protein